MDNRDDAFWLTHDAGAGPLHESQCFAAAFSRNRVRGFSKKKNLKAFLERIQNRSLYTDVQRQAADPETGDFIPPQPHGQAGLVENGILVLIKADAFGYFDNIGDQRELLMKPGTIAVLDAMRRPLAALFLKADMADRVPIPRSINRDASFPRIPYPAVEDRDYLIAVFNGQAPTRAKILLDVHQKQSVPLFDLVYDCGHSISPLVFMKIITH
jgi:hypothetical protein